MANNWLLLLSSTFFNLFNNPYFLSDLSNPSVNTLPMANIQTLLVQMHLVYILNIFWLNIRI